MGDHFGFDGRRYRARFSCFLGLFWHRGDTLLRAGGNQRVAKSSTKSVGLSDL
jgi:hypothetical protein